MHHKLVDLKVTAEHCIERKMQTAMFNPEDVIQLVSIILQIQYLLQKGLHEISAAYSPDDMRIAGRAEMQLALNVINGEALKGKEE